MTEINLYKVHVVGAIKNANYFIVAESFDAAAAKALEMDASDELENGGASSVEIVATAGGPDASWTMTAAAADSLGFS